jgi:hypothetical protein
VTEDILFDADSLSIEQLEGDIKRLEEQLEATQAALWYYSKPRADGGALAKAVLGGQRPPEVVFEFFRKEHGVSNPAISPDKAGGWCDKHGGYLGRRCATCALESAPASEPEAS